MPSPCCSGPACRNLQYVRAGSMLWGGGFPPDCQLFVLWTFSFLSVSAHLSHVGIPSLPLLQQHIAHRDRCVCADFVLCHPSQYAPCKPVSSHKPHSLSSLEDFFFPWHIFHPSLLSCLPRSKYSPSSPEDPSPFLQAPALTWPSLDQGDMYSNQDPAQKKDISSTRTQWWQGLEWFRHADAELLQHLGMG